MDASIFLFHLDNGFKMPVVIFTIGPVPLFLSDLSKISEMSIGTLWFLHILSQ